jgi:hypothetical protein
MQAAVINLAQLTLLSLIASARRRNSLLGTDRSRVGQRRGQRDAWTTIANIVTIST